MSAVNRPDLPEQPGLWTALVGTFNESAGDGSVLPASHGLVSTVGWPADPQVIAGSGLDASSWLVAGRPGTPTEGRLYAAQHITAGTLTVLEPGPDGGWVTVQQIPSHGEDTCHTDLNPSATWIAAASYGSATLTVAPVHDDGRLGEPIAVRAPAGSGPVASRQQEPHLHFVLFLDDDRLLVTDLGADRLLEYSIDQLSEGRTEPQQVHGLPSGSGPRHVALLDCPDGRSRRLAVVGELDSRLHILDLPEGPAGPEGFREVATVPTHSPDADPDAVRENQPSHLVLSADGELMYVANRGRNTIGVIRLGDRPELVAEVPCGGEWPRHLDLVAGPDAHEGHSLLVALERADAVVHLPLDEHGIPGEPGGKVTVLRPGFVLPHW